jgi:hypothetical protein
MKQLVFLSVLGTIFVSGSALVQAANCASIINDGDRLSCFDEARDCAGISEAATRLSCFDKHYGGSSKPSSTSLETSGVQSKAAETAVIVDVVSESSSAKHNTSENTVASESVAKSVDSKEVIDESLAPSHAPVEGDTEATFGKKKEFSDPSDYIEAKIVEVKRNSQKIDYIRLDNGHVWREYQDYRTRFKVGQTVVIEEGVLGSFNMKVEGVTKLIKVKRVK